MLLIHTGGMTALFAGSARPVGGSGRAGGRGSVCFAAVAAFLSPARSDSPPQREPVAVAGQWLARLRLILRPVPQRVGG